MSKIKFSWTQDVQNRSCLTAEKARGKITVDELGDALRYSHGDTLQGHYVIIINASENTCGGDGWLDQNEQKGDRVDIYPITEFDNCPICNKFLPPFDNYPDCGEKLIK